MFPLYLYSLVERLASGQ